MNMVHILIPLAIGPEERGDRFEDAICDLFDEDDGGDIVGGGTYGDKDGITGAEIQLAVKKLAIMNRIVEILRAGGAPPESTIKLVDQSKDEVTSIRLGDWVDVV